jgi:hypothetical protein
MDLSLDSTPKCLKMDLSLDSTPKCLKMDLSLDSTPKCLKMDPSPDSILSNNNLVSILSNNNLVLILTYLKMSDPLLNNLSNLNNSNKLLVRILLMFFLL